jgi:arylformamidase
MPIHDVSLPISESLVAWPGDPRPAFVSVLSLDRGDSATVTRLDLSAHTGTHVDAPAHFVQGGAGVDSLDLDVLVGPAHVIDGGAARALSARVLEALSIPPAAERLLFRTRNSERWARREFSHEFVEDFVAVTEDGARWLVERGVRLVGVDYLSVAPFADPVPAHRVLLQGDVVVVEGLDLSGVSPGAYRFACLPLRLVGVEGAPARAILMD